MECLTYKTRFRRIGSEEHTRFKIFRLSSNADFNTEMVILKRLGGALDLLDPKTAGPRYFRTWPDSKKT